MENFQKIIFTIIFISFCVAVQMQKPIKIPKTKFSCEGRIAGYYADVDTGCQFYHMCDGLGRKFSYSCPNTTLFQQRMFICDHWYMVNCSTSERDYKANLLIGQKDKPFVAENEDHQRTPRPDILSLPYAQGFNYYNDLVEDQNPSGPDRTIVTIDNEIGNGKNDLIDDQASNPAPNHWSTELNGNVYTTPSSVVKKEVSGFSGKPIIVTGPSSFDGEDYTTSRYQNIPVNTPSKFFEPPKFSFNDQQETTQQQTKAFSTTVRSIASFNNQFLSGTTKGFLDVTGSQEESVQFSTETQTTERIQSGRSFDTAAEIQTSSETAGFIPIIPINNQIPNVPSKNIQSGTNIDSKKSISTSQVTTVTEKIGENENSINSITENSNVAQPALELLPPKFEYGEIASTTMGPPIYYEWKWANAFDLQPPKLDEKDQEKINEVKGAKEGLPEFALPRTTTERSITTQKAIDQTTSEGKDSFKLSPYFIPDYTFPLDKQHPGYQEDGAMTSFQVRIPSDKDNLDHPYYGENSECPQCHPSFVVPGTCKPCVMIRR